MGLTLTVLGCSGTYSGPGNPCSGYLVQGGGATVWLDCGPGTMAALQRHVTLADVDAVVISHSHPDHWLELPVLRNAYRYAEHREGVPVYSTSEVFALLDSVAHGDAAPTFACHAVSDGASVDVGALRFTFSRTDHPVETLAVRVSETATGATLVYSADTGPGWSPAAFGPADLFLCEASLLASSEGEGPHVSARQAATMASDTGARRLVITHVLPNSDPAAHVAEAEAAFGGPVELATPDARFTL